MLRRALSGFLALVFLSVAGLSIAGAGWLWSTFSADSVVSSALGRISGTAASQAVVIDVERVGSEVPYLPVTGEAVLIATPGVGSPGPPEVFMAQAPADIANEYLSGARYDVARYVDGRWSITPVPGFRDLDPPQDVTWSSSANGSSARLRLAADTPTTVIVMNADGSPPVDVLLAVQMKVPDAVTIAVVLAVLAVVALVIGLVVLRSALGRGRKRGSHEAATT